MKGSCPRLRMFAGPNGSGKSTIKDAINPEWLGVYINSDDIEKDIRDSGFLDFSAYEVETTASEVLPFFSNSSFLARNKLADDAELLSFTDGNLNFNSVQVNSYFASVAADFIRRKLLDAKVSLTFETVMSHDSKVKFLKEAQEQGYRTYLYYVATEDTEINISRVENRVKAGGHPVPKQKIVSRYSRSLALLADAVQFSDRAYIFDNSSHEKAWIAEITDGDQLELKTDTIPNWFNTALWDKFSD